MIRDTEIYVLNDKIIDLQSQIIQIRDELCKEGGPVIQVYTCLKMLILLVGKP